MQTFDGNKRLVDTVSVDDTDPPVSSAAAVFWGESVYLIRVRSVRRRGDGDVMHCLKKSCPFCRANVSL